MGLGAQVGYGGAATQLSSFKMQQGPSGKQNQRCWVLGKAGRACACRSVRLSLCGLAVLLVSLKGSGVPCNTGGCWRGPAELGTGVWTHSHLLYLPFSFLGANSLPLVATAGRARSRAGRTLSAGCALHQRAPCDGQR